MLDKRKFYINGQWVAPETANDHEVINPSTEEACAVISLGSAADTDKAAAAARAAFEPWMNTPKAARLALLENLLEVYNRRADDMAEAISLEMGAPIDMSKQQQVTTGAFHIKTFIETFKDFQFDRMLGDHAPLDRILMEPIGVVGMITPWNWPMNQIALKVIPAMATG